MCRGDRDAGQRRAALIDDSAADFALPDLSEDRSADGQHDADRQRDESAPSQNLHVSLLLTWYASRKGAIAVGHATRAWPSWVRSRPAGVSPLQDARPYH